VPELPEVETVRRTLEPHLVGRRIASVTVGRERVVRRTSVAALIGGMRDAVVVAVRRRGKYLLCDLDNERSVMVHLRMSGQLLMADAATPRPPHTHVAMGLDDGAELRFVDPRTFGEVVVFDPARVESEVPELARLGIDPIVDEFTVGDLRRVVRGHRRRLKALLLDQHQIAGIGNIYSDEMLHRARLHPLRRSDTLSRSAEAGLHRCILEVLTEAIDAGGSTLDDAAYVDVDGVAGSYQQHHVVYGRVGQRCGSCDRGRIRRIQVAQRSTHYCPVCQRVARVAPARAISTTSSSTSRRAPAASN
jgi:formamidopyrimidine-DNA glycosylase